MTLAKGTWNIVYSRDSRNRIVLRQLFLLFLAKYGCFFLGGLSTCIDLREKNERNRQNNLC